MVAGCTGSCDVARRPPEAQTDVCETARVSDVYYDPYDAAIDADPHPVWKRLRDEAPVYYNEQHDFWALSRYDDVLAGLLDWETFSSARGITIEMIDTDPARDTAVAVDGIRPMVIMMDPPGHDRLRKLMSRTFTPRRVGLLEDRVRELCAEALDPHRDGSTFDFMETCGSRIPGMIIGALMGVPVEDQDTVRAWIDICMEYQDGPMDDRKMHAFVDVDRYMVELVEARRRQPGDDLVSDLLASEIELAGGGRSQLTNEEVLGFAQLLLFAGNETTARLIGWTMMLLARFPDQRRLLVEDPSLVPNAIEELLRYEAPSPIQGRFVTRDVEFHGITIPANSRIALLNASADRDERYFADPDVLDVRRAIDRHLAFGYGAHFCMGAALARIEGRLVLEETLQRFPEWDVDEDAMRLVRTSTVRGPSYLPFSGR